MSESTNNIDLALRAIFLQLNLPYQSELLPLGADTKNIKESDQKKEFIRLSFQDAMSLTVNFSSFGISEEFAYLNGMLDRFVPYSTREEKLQQVFYFDKEKLLNSFKELEIKLSDLSFKKKQFKHGVLELKFLLVDFILYRTKEVIPLFDSTIMKTLIKKLILKEYYGGGHEKDILNLLAKLVSVKYPFNEKSIYVYLNEEILDHKSMIADFEENPPAEDSEEYIDYIDNKNIIRKLEAAQDLIKSLLISPPVAPPPPNPFAQSSVTSSKPQSQPSPDRGDVKGEHDAGTMREASTVRDAGTALKSSTAHEDDKKNTTDQTKDTDKTPSNDNKTIPKKT